MLLPSLETTSVGLWAKNKPNSAAATNQAASDANSSDQPLLSAAASSELHLQRVDEKQSGQGDSLTSGGREPEVAYSEEKRQPTDAAPDFTLKLSGQESPAYRIQREADPDRPDRAKLPYTFDFGVRRPMAVAVVMSRPQMGDHLPGNRSQAIQQTFDLAATNLLPYAKGSQINLVA